MGTDSRYPVPGAEVRAWMAAHELLCREARLLDDRRFDEWLDLFTSEALYVLPIRDESRRGEPALIRDSRQALEERVYRLTQTTAHAQDPPSRTQHDLSNLEVLESDGERLVVACNQTVHELRVGDPLQSGLGEVRSFHARCRYRLVASSGGMLIDEKRCELVNRDYPLHNLTFIF
jgi:ethylbenzene dioxygenase beta subunit